MNDNASAPAGHRHLAIFVFMLLLFVLLGSLLIRYIAVQTANIDDRMKILLSVMRAGGFVAAISFVYFLARLLRAAWKHRLPDTWMLSIAGIVVALATGVLLYRHHVDYRQTQRTDHSMRNLRMLAVMLVAYGREKGVPTAQSRDAEHQPLLSWRVHLLEFYEPKLYHKFHLGEPWDSSHNRRLISQIPSVYQSARAPTVADGKTCYLMAVGQGAFYPYPASYRPTNSQQMIDWQATSELFGRHDVTQRYSPNTLLIVEVLPEFAVIWTKPDDLVFDPQRPKATLVSEQREYFLAINADLSPRSFSSDLSDETVRSLFVNDRARQLDVTRIANQEVRRFDTWTIFVRPSAR